MFRSKMQKNSFHLILFFLLSSFCLGNGATANPFCEEEFWKNATQFSIKSALNKGHNFDEYCDDQKNKYKAGNFALARLPDSSFLDLLVQGQLDLNAKTSEGRSVLHSAVFSNQPSLLVGLIARGVNPNSRDARGVTPLNAACSITDDPRMIEVLIDMGASKSTKDDIGQTCFYNALKYNGRYEIIRYILEKEFPTNYEDCFEYIDSKDPCQPVIPAYMDGVFWNMFGDEKINISTKVLDLLISEGFNVNAVSIEGKHRTNRSDPDSERLIRSTALRSAIQRKDKNLVEYLLSKGANINQRMLINGKAKGRTPIFDAINPLRGGPDHDLISFLVFKGASLDISAGLYGTPLTHAIDEDLETAGLLLDLGANIEARDWLGLTALLYASSSGKLDAVQFLLSRGANINAADSYGHSVLHLAAKEESVETLKTLVSRGAKLKSLDKEGHNLLHLAAAFSLNPLMVRSLIQDFGFDVNGVTSDDYANSPLILAAKYNVVVGVMTELLRNGADPNFSNASGFTPLHAVTKTIHGNKVVDQPLRIGLLLDAGAQVNQQTNKEKATALMFAVVNGNQQSIVRLIEEGADPRIQNKEGQNALEIYVENGGSKESNYLGRGYWALHDRYFN